MTNLTDARAKKLYTRMKGRMSEQNKCVPTKETHVNCTKGAPKNQKTKSQRAKIELMKYNSSELRGTKKEKEQSKIDQIPNHQ